MLGPALKSERIELEFMDNRKMALRCACGRGAGLERRLDERTEKQNFLQSLLLELHPLDPLS